MSERYSNHAQQAMVVAQEQALRLGRDHVGTEHILLGLLEESEGAAAKVLDLNGVSFESVLQKVEENTGPGPCGSSSTVSPPFTPRAKKVLELAMREAIGRGNSHVGTDHILLGLLREGHGVGVRALASLGVDLKGLRAQVTELLSGMCATGLAEVSGGNARRDRVVLGRRALLDEFGCNLTQLAREHKLDPVIGRDGEVERVMQVLSRRTKSNPVLIGEPGVGKTAVVEGLAQRIVSGNVPENLRAKSLYSLDLGALVAGSRYRGDFEARLKKVLNEVRARADIILFIDEMHTLVGTGAGEGGIDAASILKPLLARGELQAIGATTLDEYRKHVEKDGALARRFQPVKVKEPSLAQTIEILRGLRERYEGYHGVTITDQAVVAAATLADRYIADRYLPDKAIDLIDEAGARLRVRRMTVLPAYAAIEGEIVEVRKDKELAIAGGDIAQSERLREREEALLQRQAVQEQSWQAQGIELFDVVDEQVIAEVLADWTGIPVSKLTEEETAKLLRMEDELHRRIIGQDDAVKAVSLAIRRTRAGLKDPKRPSGSFIFLGPSGVGKTETAKALAEFLFGDESALVQLDMSEYMEKHAVSRLVGSPPGYVGYQEGGQLTEAVRRNPFSVVLFDEIEKANPDVFNTLLQVLEEGRLTDAQGRTVDFKNTVIIMTSNLGTADLHKSSIGFATVDQVVAHEKVTTKVYDALKQHFPPEFLNRVDDMIVFHALSEDEMSEIIDVMVKRLRGQLEAQGLGIELTKAAKYLIVEQGYDPLLGARPLRRALQRMVEAPLSEKVLSKEFVAGDMIIVDAANGEITFSVMGHSELPEVELAGALSSN